MFGGLISPLSGRAELHKTIASTFYYLHHVEELYWFLQNVTYSRWIGALEIVKFLDYKYISKLQNIWSLQLLHA